MKTTEIQIPIEGEESIPRIKSLAHDFLVDAIAVGDLGLDLQAFMTFELGIPQFYEKYDFEGEPYNIYIIEVSGDDKAIDVLEKWQNGFKQALN